MRLLAALELSGTFAFARFIDSHLALDLGAAMSDGKRRCSTELITILNPDQTILVIHGDFASEDIYLRFFQEKGRLWRFGGAYASYIKNHRRRHEVDRSSGTPFLRISSQGVRGSDVDSEMEYWILTQRSGGR